MKCLSSRATTMGGAATPAIRPLLSRPVVLSHNSRRQQWNHNLPSVFSSSCSSWIFRQHTPIDPSPRLPTLSHFRTFTNSSSLFFLNSLLSSLPSSSTSCPLRQLTHTKSIPYSSSSVFQAVADVSGYPTFLPFAISSDVTQRDGNGYPQKATLKIGVSKFGVEIDETWESEVRCDPKQGTVEARSGTSSPVSSSTSSSSSASTLTNGRNNNGLFEVLATRWKIVDLPSDSGATAAKNKTSVKLDIDVKFRNPIYDQMFAQVSGRVANTMIDAFEKKVQELEKQ